MADTCILLSTPPVPPPLVHRDPPLAPSLLRSVGADPPLGRSLPGLRVTPPSVGRSLPPSHPSSIMPSVIKERVPPVPPGWREQGRKRLLPPPLPLSTRRPPLPRMRICEALRARPPAVCANDAGSAAPVCCHLAACRWEWTPPSLCALSLDESGPPLRSLALSNVRES